MEFPTCPKYIKFVEDAKEYLQLETLKIILITGKVGSGKSVAAQHLGYAIAGERFTQQCVALTNQELVKAIAGLTYTCVVADEGTALFNTHDTLKTENKIAMRVIDQCRQNHIIILICTNAVSRISADILDATNCIIEVRERVVKRGDKKVRIKGELYFYPAYTRHNFCHRYMAWCKGKRFNPLKKLNKPRPAFRQGGQNVNTKVFYPIDEAVYKKRKKDLILEFIK